MSERRDRQDQVRQEKLAARNVNPELDAMRERAEAAEAEVVVLRAEVDILKIDVERLRQVERYRIDQHNVTRDTLDAVIEERNALAEQLEQTQ